MGVHDFNLRALTWNIHGGVGLDFRHNIKRIGEVIHSLSPDIAAIQEVDLRRSSDISSGTYEFLKNQVGNYSYNAWTIKNSTGQYGHVLLSRYPMENEVVHDVSIPGREPRKIIEALIKFPLYSVKVFAAHLGIWQKDKNTQIDRLCELIQENKSAPVLVMGDLNEWFGNQVNNKLDKLVNSKTDLRSFPSCFPVLRLDKIMCTGKIFIKHARLAREAGFASDHLPVVADIKFNHE